MNIKASGRSALIIAAGFWVCVSGPLQAAEDADGGVTASRTETAAGPPVALSKFTKKSRHWKHVSSQRKSVKVARDSTERAKTSEKNVSEKKKTFEADAALNDDGSAPSLPPAVANANAQMAAADGPADSATALSSQARDRLQVMAASQPDPQAQPPAPNTELVAADELNDVDRALSENGNDDKDKAPSATLAMAAAQAQAPAQIQAAAVVSPDDSTWSQTSLIGKIFIAFGGLLTLASAARMFMA
jgi:hypothetical protein